MNEQLHRLVKHTLAQGVGARVFPLRWENRRIWVKQAVPPKTKGWHKLQRFFATITRLSALRPTVSPGGAEGLKREAETLRRLANAGILVPRVEGQTDQWIAISDNGDILQRAIEDALKAGNVDQAKQLVKMAGKALAVLHNAHVAHGAPLLRNMTIDAAVQVGFIDFEEDPESQMNVHDAQARDILLFVFSIQRGFKRHPELLRDGWNAYLYSVPGGAEQLASLAKIARFLKPVYKILMPFYAKLGTDARSAIEAYRVLHQGLHGRKLH